MNAVVVDTDVFSFVFKGDDRAEAYRGHLDGRIVVLSFMSVAELYRWALLRGWGSKKRALLREQIGACLVVETDDEIRWEWARVMSVRGRPVGTSDAWVAATALRYKLPLVTHNRVDFEHIPELQLLSEA